eukprot:UN32318
MKYEHIRAAILSLDENLFNEDKVSQLAILAPNMEEVAAVTSYEGDHKALDKCGKFFYALKDVPDVKNRLRQWEFKLSFDRKMKTAMRQITILQKAYSALYNSESVKEFFELYLVWAII